MDNAINDFMAGNRVEMHPATDLWMRGARYGNVIYVGRKMVLVQLDALEKPVKVRPRDLRHVIGENL